jgi:hypothetical protein
MAISVQVRGINGVHPGAAVSGNHSSGGGFRRRCWDRTVMRSLCSQQASWIACVVSYGFT